MRGGGLKEMQDVGRMFGCKKAVISLQRSHPEQPDLDRLPAPGRMEKWAGQEGEDSCALCAFSVSAKPGPLSALFSFIPTTSLCIKYYHSYFIDKEIKPPKVTFCP